LINQITTNVEQKIFEINEHQDKLLKEASEILIKGQTSANTLKNQLVNMERTVSDCMTKDFDNISNDHEKVNKFMQFHRQAIDLLSDVGHWGDTKYCFDPEKFCIEVDFQQPSESVESMVLYYR
jgi:GTP1/Obg family GTP-binding protein